MYPNLNFPKSYNDYMKTSNVTPRLLLSPITTCCDNEGNLKPYIEGSIYKTEEETTYQRNFSRLSQEEVLFVHYLKAIRFIFNNDEKLKDPKLEKQNQFEINRIIELFLVEYFTDIDLSKKIIDFDHKKFIEKNTTFPLGMVKEMPYILSYISLKSHYPTFLDIERFSPYNFKPNFKIDKKLKVCDDEYIESISLKIGTPYKNLLSPSYLRKTGRTL